ncbi:hypothetical protein CRUP_036831 [Coryphaenoides rupestris]|nr:hypothetical protein CRUP_036831 [Coryphaenoides rupestris]
MWEKKQERHSPADYTLLSVQVMIRHGDRYPLYSIPKTKRPTIDCTLSPNSSVISTSEDFRFSETTFFFFSSSKWAMWRCLAPEAKYRSSLVMSTFSTPPTE